MDPDPFGEVYLNYSNITVTNSSNVINITYSFAAFLIDLLGFCTNLFLIITMIKFKRLRTHINMYILHLAIASVISYSVAVVVEILYIFILIPKIHCWSYPLEISTMCFMFLVSPIMTLEWILVTFKSSWLARTKPFFKYSIPIAYAIYFSFWVAHFVGCTTTKETFMWSVRFVYYLSLLIMVVCDIYLTRNPVSIEASKTKYCVLVANIIVFCWLPECVLSDMVDAFFWYKWYTLILYVEILFYPFSLLGSMANIIVVFVLVKKDKYFKMAFSKVFKSNLSTYEAENLDDSDDMNYRIEASNIIDREP